MRRSMLVTAVAVVTAIAASPALATPSYVGPVASRSVVDTGNTLALTVSAAGVAAGETVIVVGSKGQDQEAVAGATDSRGNAYRVDKQLHGPAGSGMSMTVVSGYIANALLPGDKITISYEGASAYTNRFGAAYDFSGLGAASFDSATSAAGYGSAVVTGSTPSSQDGDVVFGLFELQTPAAAFTPEAGLNPLAQVIGNVVNETLQPVWKIAGAAGPQAAAGTIGAFASWTGIAVTYRSGTPPPAAPPVVASPPSIAGTPRVGLPLTATTGSWSGTAPIAYSYRWQRCSAGTCMDVGADASSYTPVAADVGALIQVVVTASNAAGSASGTSAPTDAVAAAGTAPSFVQTVARSSVTDDNSNQLVLTVPASGVAVGDTVIVVGSRGGQDPRPIQSVVDSRGNAYAADAIVHTDLPAGVFSAPVVASLLPGDTITITFEGATAYTNRFAAAYEFSGIAGTNLGGRNIGLSNTGYGSDLLTPATPTPLDGELLLGVFDIESSAPGVHPGADFQTLPAVTGSAVGHTLASEWRIAGAASGVGETASATLDGFASWTGLVVAYRPGTPVQSSLPVNVTPPPITGTPSEGQQLQAGYGTWSNALTYRLQWQRCDASSVCTDIAGATGATYVLTHADVGLSVRALATATNASGSAWAASAAVAVIAAAKPMNVTPPVVDGTATVGSTLRSDTGTWSGATPMTAAYSWLRCDALGSSCQNTGSVGAAYVLHTADVGATLRVVVTETNAGGSAAAASGPSAVVTAPPVTPVTTPLLQGTPIFRSVTDDRNNQIQITFGSAGGVQAGETLVLVATRGSDSEGIASVTDSRGNAYSVDVNAPDGTGSGMAFGVASGYIATPLASQDTITVTFEGAPSWSTRAVVAYEFSGLVPAAKDVTAVSSGYGSTLVVAAPSTGKIAQGNELVFGTFAIASNSPGFLPDPGGSFTALAPLSVAGVNHTFQSEFRVESRIGSLAFADGQINADTSYTGAVVTYRGS